MNERDFDKLFSDKLNHEGDFPNKDKVKATVFSRLDNELPVVAALPPSSNNTSTLLKSLWALPFLLLLMGWNSCQWWQIKNLKQVNSSLQADVQGLKTANSIISLRRDTVMYQSKIIYKTDTIYKTVYLFEKNISANNVQSVYSLLPKETSSVGISSEQTVRQKLTENNKGLPNTETHRHETEKPITAVNPTTISSNKVTNDKTLDNKTSEKPIAVVNKDSLETKTPLVIKKEGTETVTKTQDSLKNEAMKSPDSTILKQIVAIQELPKDSFEQALSKQSLKEDESTKPIIKRLKWGDAYIGFNTGITMLAPAVKNINPALWFGVSGEYAFDDTWRVALSTDWSRLNFKTYEPSAPLNLPEINSPGSHYRFKYIEGTQKATQLGIAMQYALKTERSLKPFISVGYMYRNIPASIAKYEFINTITDEERYVYQDVVKHKDHWWLLGIGANTRLNAHFSARLKLEYAYDFNRYLGSGSNGYVILRGGILYRF